MKAVTLYHLVLKMLTGIWSNRSMTLVKKMLLYLLIGGKGKPSITTMFKLEEV